MSLSVTSDYWDKLEDTSLMVSRKCWVGSDDYSDRVISYPSIKRDASDLSPVSVTVPLANNDGALNDFYANTYSIKQDLTLQLGLLIPDSIFQDLCDSDQTSQWAALNVSSVYFDTDHYVFLGEQGGGGAPGPRSQLLSAPHSVTSGDIYNITLDVRATGSWYPEDLFIYTDVGGFGKNVSGKLNPNVNGYLTYVFSFHAELTTNSYRIGLRCDSGQLCNFKNFKFDSVDIEYANVYKGPLRTVKYSGKTCKLISKDKVWDLSQKVVGDSDNPIEWTTENPMDIAWDLCTCYGGFDSTTSTSNVDINYNAWLAVYSDFGQDAVTMDTRFDGQKITEALNSVLTMGDCTGWTDGEALINFSRWQEVSSLDQVFMNSHMTDLVLTVNEQGVINRQYVQYDYAQDSNYWQNISEFTYSGSVNSFGLHEEIIKDSTTWFTNDTDALNLASRKVSSFKKPPIDYEASTGLIGMRLDIADTLRLVNSFYGIDSGSAWKVQEHNYNMNNSEVEIVLNSSRVLVGFYLDIDFLDGDKLLL